MSTTAELATQVIKATQALQLAGIQANCTHVFTDEYHDTTCYKCGLEVNI